MGWYKTGNVSIIAGETSITGVGVKFASNSRVGDGFRAPDGRWYEVVNIASETVLGIYPPYRGDTVSGSADYMIAPLQGYNKDSADRLRWVTDNIRSFDAEVAAVQAAKAAALISENNAKASENAAKTSETNAKTSETAASNSASAAQSAEISSTDNAASAQASKDAALISENNAKASELASKASEVASKASEDIVKASALAAKTSETNAKASETASKTSETNAKTSETNSASNASTATTAATTATNAKDAAEAAKVLAEKARDDAQAASGTVTGVVKDGGPINLSSGVYPTRPVTSTFWKVVVGGTVTDGGVTIEYGVGDTLMFSKISEEFYKIDNTESVSSVAGKTGVVVINKTDVGLSNVDNTSDLNKPVSTAVQTQLDNRTPTVGKLDTTAGRLLKVGDYGWNGGTAISLTNTDAARSLTVSGMYAFGNGGVDLPVNGQAWYVRVSIHGTLRILEAFGMTSLNAGKTFVQSYNGTVWSGWIPPAAEVVDNLTSTDTTKALSANQGKVLKDLIDAGGGGSAVNISRFTYNLSAGQTVISGVDLSGATLSYTPGVPLFVDLNGFPIWIGNDYTATNGTSITLTTGVEAASEIAITVFKAKGVNDTYTKAEIDGKIGASALPVGVTVPWSLSEATIPGGMLPYNGQLVSRAVWPTLWALVSSQAISDATWLASPYLDRGKFSSGDGSTTFRLPDFNGKYVDGNTPAAAVLRGYGKNSAGTPGLFQLDQMQGHRHSGSIVFGGSNNLGTSAQYIQASNTGDPVTDGTNGTPRVGTETRSTNVTVIWCVVAATALQNIGTVDVLALATTVASIQARPQVLTKEFVSAPQTIVWGGGLTLPHGLGVKPKLVTAYLVCTVATGNFAVGDETFWQLDYEQANSALVIFGFTCKRDVTNLIVRISGSGIFLQDPVTSAIITSQTVNTNFKIVFEAWA
jgi:hypothetical protein